MKKEQIQIDTEFIRLDSLLKLSGGAVTGGGRGTAQVVLEDLDIDWDDTLDNK